MKKTIIILALFSLLLTPSLSLASNDDSTLQVVQTLLEQGNAKDAYQYIMIDHDSTSTNPQEWFLMGIAAKATGRPREASKYLQKSIELDPNHSDRARLELAPPKVGDNIEKFMQFMEDEGAPRQWRLRGSLGYMYDSNANAGPSIDSVLMYDLPFILSAEAKEHSGNAALLHVGGDYMRGITDDISWQSSLTLNSTSYNNYNELDSRVASASTGLSMRISDDWSGSLPIVVDWVKIGHDKSYYSYSYGVAPQIRYSYSPKLSFNLGGTIGERKYQTTDSKRDLDRYSISPMLIYQINQMSFMRFGLVAGKEDSGYDFYSNDLLGGNIMYGYTFRWGLQATLSGSYSNTEYDGKEAAYNKERHDKTSRIGIDLTYPLNKNHSNLVLSASHTDNDSNLEMYEYDRDQISLSIEAYF
jgi:opacity protein-like surface antigen